MVFRHLVVDHLGVALRLVLGDANLPAAVDAVRALDHPGRARANVDDHAVAGVDLALALVVISFIEIVKLLTDPCLKLRKITSVNSN